MGNTRSAFIGDDSADSCYGSLGDEQAAASAAVTEVSAAATEPAKESSAEESDTELSAAAETQVSAMAATEVYSNLGDEQAAAVAEEKESGAAEISAANEADVSAAALDSEASGSVSATDTDNPDLIDDVFIEKAKYRLAEVLASAELDTYDAQLWTDDQPTAVDAVVEYTHRVDYGLLDAQYLPARCYWNSIDELFEINELVREVLLMKETAMRPRLAAVMAEKRCDPGAALRSAEMEEDANVYDYLNLARLEVLLRLDYALNVIRAATMTNNVRVVMEMTDEERVDEISSLCVVDRSDTSLDDDEIEIMSPWKVEEMQVYERPVRGSSRWKRAIYGKVHRGVIVKLLDGEIRGCSEFLIHKLCNEENTWKSVTIVAPVTSVNTDYVWTKIESERKSGLTQTTVGDCLAACGKRYSGAFNNCAHAVERMMRRAR